MLRVLPLLISHLLVTVLQSLLVVLLFSSHIIQLCSFSLVVVKPIIRFKVLCPKERCVCVSPHPPAAVFHSHHVALLRYNPYPTPRLGFKNNLPIPLALPSYPPSLVCPIDFHTSKPTIPALKYPSLGQPSTLPPPSSSLPLLSFSLKT